MIRQSLTTTFKLIALLNLASCSSYQQFRQITEEFDPPSQIYDATYDKTWQAILSVMKKFELKTTDPEKGIFNTQWMDNTQGHNFANVFTPHRNIKSAKFQLHINAAKGYRMDREVTRVTIYKRQLIEQDILQGFKEIPSDKVLEQILLYRIKRLLAIEKYLDKIQQEKERKQLKSFEQ